ncbi:MAG: tetratricopeptide repeat protein [Burkholderiales bacterium]|nr:tetratricopeptide repeat protein [Burkholderiales bacterium]
MSSPSSRTATSEFATQAMKFQAEGRLADAVAAWRQAMGVEPENPKYCYGAAAASFATGKWTDAVVLARQALHLKPDFWAAQLLLGSASLEAGQPSEAVKALQAAASSRPDSAEAQMLLGIALQAQGRLSEAEPRLREAARIQPHQAATHYALGRLLASIGSTQSAIESFKTALSIAPDHVETLFAIGQALCTTGRAADALEYLERAVEIQPQNANLLNALGVVYKDLSRMQEAVLCYRRCLQLMPDHADALGNLGMFSLAEGDITEAKRCFDESLSARQDGRVRVTRDLMLPPIMGDWPSVLDCRRQYSENLEKLIADDVRLDSPEKAVVYSNFYLAYHGLNNRDLQQRFAHFCLKACPSLGFESPKLHVPRKPGPKRIGFLSRNLYEHSVALCYGQMVAALAKRKDFEIHLIAIGSEFAARPADAYADFSGKVTQLPIDLADARKCVADLDLDVLVYLDIGMDSQSLFLAFARLARVQCVLGGHPDTTGIPNIDHFISSNLAELPEADDHYSENLIRLRSSTFIFERPVLPERFTKSRADFGLPTSGRLYMCPVKLQKIHPHFDAIFNDLLEADPDGWIVLFEDYKAPLWSKLLSSRLDRSIRPSLRSRIIFIPWVRNSVDFANVNALANVVLDPLHFGIGSTAIALFAVGAPIVTLPTALLPGRTGLFYSRLLDLPEFIATDAANYVEKAVQLASSPEAREALRGKILSRHDILYDTMSAVNDLSDLFEQL